MVLKMYFKLKHVKKSEELWIKLGEINMRRTNDVFTIRQIVLFH